MRSTLPRASGGASVRRSSGPADGLRAARRAAGGGRTLDLCGSGKLPDHSMVRNPPLRQPATADSLARNAERLAAKGDFAAALPAAEEALALDPGNPLALRVAGSIARRTGNHEVAEGYLRRALERDADDRQIQRELATCLADRGDVARAIALLPLPSANDAEAWFELGVLHDQNADGPAALDAAQRVERLQPGHGGAQLLIARALTALGRIGEAAARYRKLTRWPGLASRAWFGLLDLKTVRLAADELRDLERLAKRQGLADPDRKLIGYALGQACEMAGRTTDAVRAFRAAVVLRRIAPARPADTSFERPFAGRFFLDLLLPAGSPTPGKGYRRREAPRGAAGRPRAAARSSSSQERLATASASASGASRRWRWPWLCRTP